MGIHDRQERQDNQVSEVLRQLRRNRRNVKLPEDHVDWDGEQPFWCAFYPRRDCPGCLLSCARIGDIITDDIELPQRRWPHEV